MKSTNQRGKWWICFLLDMYGYRHEIAYTGYIAHVLNISYSHLDVRPAMTIII